MRTTCVSHPIPAAVGSVFLDRSRLHLLLHFKPESIGFLRLRPSLRLLYNPPFVRKVRTKCLNNWAGWIGPDVT